VARILGRPGVARDLRMAVATGISRPASGHLPLRLKPRRPPSARRRPVRARRRTASARCPATGGPSQPVRGRHQAVARRPRRLGAPARPPKGGPGHHRAAARGRHPAAAPGHHPAAAPGHHREAGPGRPRAAARGHHRAPARGQSRARARGRRRGAARGRLLAPLNGPHRAGRTDCGLRLAPGRETCPAAGRAPAAASAPRLMRAARPGVTRCAARPGELNRAARRTDVGRVPGPDWIHGQLPGRPAALATPTRRPPSSWRLSPARSGLNRTRHAALRLAGRAWQTGQPAWTGAVAVPGIRT
jgi:hypothetical protein